MPSSNAEAFNAKVLEELREKVKGLYLPSCLGMKKLLKSNHIDAFNKANSVEVNESQVLGDGEPLKDLGSWARNKGSIVYDVRFLSETKRTHNILMYRQYVC